MTPLPFGSHVRLMQDARRTFEHPYVRPTPNHMASLIMRDFNEHRLNEVWTDHGSIPAMHQTLYEADTVLPFVHTINDTLADEDRGSMHVFGDRDAGSLFDDFKIAHAGRESTLLPASMPLWRSRSMRNPDMARDFLSTYGITPELAADTSVDFKFIDTGFMGSAGVAFRNVLRLAYKDKVTDSRVSIKLVHANPDGHGTFITRLDGVTAAMFPKTIRLAECPLPPEGAVATALQLQPRYHGAYIKSKRQPDGTAIAIPKRESYVRNTDFPAREIGNRVISLVTPLLGTNTSIVHPLAAARVQYRTVQEAVQRTYR